MKRLSCVLAAIIVVSVLASCAPAAAPAAAPVKETVIVEKEVTREVEKIVLASPEAAVVVATAVPVAASDKPVVGGTFRFGTNEPINLWDPIHTQMNSDLWAEQQVFETLAKIGPDATTLEPAVAESWTASDDGSVYTFKIRQGMMFSNGDPVTIEDVKFSLDRCRAPEATVSWILEAANTVEIVDPEHLQITLHAPSAAFLNDIVLWGCAITPQKVIEEIGDEEFAAHPVGSGPFMVTEWVKGDHVILERNPYYWGKDANGVQLPYLDKIEINEVQEDNTRILKLMSGELDATMSVPYSLVDTLKDAPGVNVEVKACAGGAGVALNQRVPALQDVKVIQALNYATDKNAIMDAVFFGYATPKLSPIHPGVWYMTEKYGYHFDLEKAKALIAESGFADGFTAELMVNSGDSVSQQIANILKEQWGEIGVDITLTPLEGGLMSSRTREKDFDMRLGGPGTADNVDPNSNWLYGFISDGGAEAGRTGWVDEEMNTLFRQSQTEMDFDKRGELYDQIQKIAMERAPFVPLYNASCVYAYRDNVENFYILPTFNYRLWETWLTE